MEVATHGSPAYLREARKAKWLSWASLAYMAVEGAVAVAAGIVAGSIALVGFGLDSAIEGFASIVIVWRFSGWRTLSRAAEDRAQKLVAVQFFLLAPFVAFESLRALAEGSRAEESLVGIALAASSLVIMPLLGRAKQRIGARIDSSATASEGKQNLLCAYLAAALLIGLLGNALFGAWWLDPIVGLLIAALAVQEGRESWRGEACC
jgi:divalent metal cation (Fe/Co/Zn/Cd) transporter